MSATMYAPATGYVGNSHVGNSHITVLEKLYTDILNILSKSKTHTTGKGRLLVLRNVVDSIQAINGQNADKIIGLRVLNSQKHTNKVKPVILSAFWPFIAWMESTSCTTHLGISRFHDRYSSTKNQLFLFPRPDSEFSFKKVDPLSACVLLKKNLDAPRNQNQILPKKASFFSIVFSLRSYLSDDPRTNPKVETRAPHGRTNLDCTEEGRRENDTAAPRAWGAYGATSRAAARGRADRADEQ